MLQNKRVSVLINYTGKGDVVTAHSKFCGPLFEHRYTDGQQAPHPPPPGFKMTAREFHRQKKIHKACSNSVIELNSIYRI